MRTLYHFWTSPFCRKVRVALAEMNLEAMLELERPWERRVEFLQLNPSGELPVMVDDDGTLLCGSLAICEYLDEAYPNVSLMGDTLQQRAETRRLIAWFDEKFNREVTEPLAGEKLNRRLERQATAPHAPSIRAGLANIHYHLDYIAYLSERRTWLAGDSLSLADIAAGAHLSVIDYLGDVPWKDHPEAKDWYARIKSRPSFRSLLSDTVPGLPPPSHYADLDF